MRGRKRLAALAIGGAIFLWLLYSLGYDATWAALTSASPAYLALTVLFFAAGSCIRIYKWVLMRDRMGASIGLGELNGIFFTSKFWGLVSPMRSGEVAPALFSEGQRGKLLSIILYDRVLETAQSLMVFVVTFFLLYGVFFNMSTGYALAGIFAALALFVFMLFSRKAGEGVFGFADSALSLFGGRRVARTLTAHLQGVRSGMDEFYEATRSYFNLGFSLYALAITFVSWGMDLLFWIVLFKAFSIDTSLLITVTSVLVYTMIAAVAPTPNGLGVSDMSLAFVLGSFGYAGEIGGLIIVSRAMVLGYTFIGYLAFGRGGAAKAGGA